MKKTYLIKPIMTPTTLTLTPTLDKPPVVRPLPPRQPLPTARIDPHQAPAQARSGCASGIHHGRRAKGSRLAPRAAQVRPGGTRRPGETVGRGRLPGVLRAGVVRLRLRVAPATGGRRGAIVSHHAHRPQRQAQDGQTGCARVVPAAFPLAGRQSRRTLTDPHSLGAGAAPARRPAAAAVPGPRDSLLWPIAGMGRWPSIAI